MRRVLSFPFLGVASLLFAQDPQWLQQHDLGNRYEGLMDQPNARREYSVVAFFAFREKMPAHPTGVLHVKYYVPQEAPVFIQARQMTWRTNYLMQSKKDSVQKTAAQWGEFQWPIDKVIGRFNVDATSLGITVRLNSDSESGEQLAPAVFYNQAEPHEPIGKYQLFLRIQLHSLAHLAYEIERRGFAPQTCHYTAQRTCAAAPGGEDGSVEVGSVVPLEIDLSQARDPGEVTIHIKGEYKNSDDKIQATYRFYHQPKYP
jgi:hypothetical protein